jgi:hypothetical protein
VSAVVRALLPTGIERLRDDLQALRSGARRQPRLELLTDPGASAELSVEVTVAPQRFATRARLGEHLWQLLAPLPAAEVEGNRGLWAWLSLYFFDQVCPMRPDGTRRPGQDYRHIPDFDFRHRYRHLLYGPYAVYRRHRGAAALLLAGPPHVEPALYQEIVARQDLIVSRGVIDALNMLYLDPTRGIPRRGASAINQPGTVRRFVRVLQQLDVTYDIHGMSGKAIVDLLPPEFDAFRSGRAMPFALESAQSA